MRRVLIRLLLIAAAAIPPSIGVLAVTHRPAESARDVQRRDLFELVRLLSATFEAELNAGLRAAEALGAIGSFSIHSGGR